MEKVALAMKMMMGDEYNEYIRGVHNKVKKLMEEARKVR